MSLIDEQDVPRIVAAITAARVSDAAWEAYIDGLPPGRDLDCAVEFALWQGDSARVQHVVFIGLGDPPDPDDPEDDGSSGRYIALYSTDLEEAVFGCMMHSHNGHVEFDYAQDRESFESTTYSASWSDDDGSWEAEGQVTIKECVAWNQMYGDDSRRVAPFAMALCRAVCRSWSPSWEAEQAAAKRALA